MTLKSHIRLLRAQLTTRWWLWRVVYGIEAAKQRLDSIQESILDSMYPRHCHPEHPDWLPPQPAWRAESAVSAEAAKE